MWPPKKEKKNKEVKMSANKFLVGLKGEELTILRPGAFLDPISKPDALNLAAWLVALATDDPKEFDPVLKEVLES